MQLSDRAVVHSMVSILHARLLQGLDVSSHVGHVAKLFVHALFLNEVAERMLPTREPLHRNGELLPGCQCQTDLRPENWSTGSHCCQANTARMPAVHNTSELRGTPVPAAASQAQLAGHAYRLFT